MADGIYWCASTEDKHYGTQHVAVRIENVRLSYVFSRSAMASMPSEVIMEKVWRELSNALFKELKEAGFLKLLDRYRDLPDPRTGKFFTDTGGYEYRHPSDDYCKFLEKKVREQENQINELEKRLADAECRLSEETAHQEGYDYY